MSWEMPQWTVSQWSADVDMSTKATWRFAPVWLGAASNITGHNGAALVAKGSLTYPPLGILYNNPIVGEAGLVCIHGICPAIIGGNVAIGDPLTPNAGGTALIKATTTGQWVIGRALEAQVSGDIGTIFCFGVHAHPLP